jgi:predicted DNA-binding antitoxin AbrB/MazE fold protein
MAVTIEAVYENGVLKPVNPVSMIPEGARLWLTLHIAAEIDRVRQAYGLLGWTGDAESVRRVALDPEFDILESP